MKDVKHLGISTESARPSFEEVVGGVCVILLPIALMFLAAAFGK